MKNFFTFLALFFAVTITSSFTLMASVGTYKVQTIKSDRNYVLNPEKAFSKFFPWTTASAVMMPCPVTQDISLDFGECGVIVPTFGFAFPDISVNSVPFVSSVNPTLINSTVYCSSGQTRYRRSYFHSGPTDLRVSSVNVGVYQSVNSPQVTFNFYTNSGAFLGGVTATVPTLSQSVFNYSIPSGIDIKIPSQTGFRMEVVANAPHISVFKIGRNDSGNTTGNVEATITASDCPLTLNQEIDPLNPGIAPNSIVFGLTGTPDDYKYTNLNNNFEEGDFFPIGEHVMSYIVTDANNSSTACAFNINVYEYEGITGALACNDLVQVSLDEDCETIVTPDMLLEGNEYGCYDDYTVQIIANNGVVLGNTVSRAQIGQILKTQIIAPNGNSCWGEILVQDKLGPKLVCEDIYATCSTDLEPGSLLSTRVPVVALIENGTIGTEPTRIKTFTIPVAHLQGTTITDLNVYLDIEHARVSDLSANITSPDGVTVPLFLGLSCTGQNVMLTMDDESANTNNTLQNTCEASTPAVAGNFKPFNPLSAFDGKPLEGDWKVTIYDLAPGVSGVVKNIHLIFSQQGGEIPFPLEGTDYLYTWVEDNTYLVLGADNCGAATLSYVDEIVEENCASIYSKIIRRCWTGSDILGNIAEPCCQYIYVYRNSLSTLQFPPNYDGLNGNPGPLSCALYGATIPPTSVTGVPFGDLCENVQLVTPVDVRIDICEKSYKLLRTHKVIEWCSGQIIVHNQVIKVEDNQGPTLSCPPNVTVSTDDYACSATYIAPRPGVSNECSNILKYVLSYNSFNQVDSEFVTLNVNQNTGEIKGLVVGNNWIKWTVTDECGNSSQCTFRVTVADLVRPNAVCDRTTVTSITGNGKAIVDAYTFDDGSVDNCGIFKYEVRKMTDRCGFGTVNFTPTVEFCCSEVGTAVMVELRVTDLYNNSNTCMVEVNVQDKLPPYITKCPADITLDCQADYENLDITGRPEYVDNCEVIDVKKQDVVKINQCGEGTVTRTWTVTDKQGYKNSCVQVIFLINDDPFYYNVFNVNDPKNDIRWPRNYETKVCYSNLDPASLPVGFNRPTFNDDNCSLVAAHYKDQVFKFVDGACEKILRTWTVIDWCTYDENNPEYGVGLYEHVQIIKLQNDVAPQFIGASGTTLDGCIDRTVPVYGNCEGDVDFSMDAIDDCPEDNTNLVWFYELFTETGSAPIATGTSKRFFRKLAIGKYRVKWTVEDRCGNEAYCTHNLNVIENKKPSPYCISSLTTAVMNSNGTISIWAKDYDKGSFDNCTPASDLWFTFFGATPVRSLLTKEHYFKGNGIAATLAEYNAGTAQIWIPDTKTSGILFDCEDIPNGVSQEVSLDMTVTDLAGNQDYCTITLVLQDNANVCPDDNSLRVVLQGSTSSNGIGLIGADVHLESNRPEQNKTIQTDANGLFSFTSLPKGYNYSIKVADNRNVINGVSTLDLVLIQRHILGLSDLADPKKVIAADADNNGRISASDLVAIRKCILGISNEFPNGQQSWRFVTNDHVFANPANPFPFKEQYTYNDLNNSKVGQNFQAIKIGDVNGSASVNAKGNNVETRNNRQLVLLTDVVDAVAGQVVEVPIYAGQFKDVLGYQFTFEFDANQVAFEGYDAATIVIDESNFGFQSVGKGILTTSWNTQEPISFDEGTLLYTVKFKANTKINGKQILKVSSKVTPALSYDSEYQASDIVLESRHKTYAGFELKQNTPNPFNELTSISFTLPEAANATITLTDVTGKVLKVISADYPKGENHVKINASDMNVSGVLFYRIDSGKYSDTKKMIIIE
jgi:subtilisin-like proprotein convertase family protein